MRRSAAASQLTLTIGFGAGLLRQGRPGPLRHRAAQTRPLADLPKFPERDARPGPLRWRHRGPGLRQRPSGRGARHPQPGLGRLRHGGRALLQLGFGRTSSTTREQSTPRNLFGFKDGTNNIKAEDTGTLNDQVWVAKGDGPDWMTGGTYLISRRIRMRIEAWDPHPTLLEQERVIGRQKGTGAPNGLTEEFDELNLDLVDNTRT